MDDDRVIYIRWSDDGQHIRKWDTKPFDGAEPMYSRSWLLSEATISRAVEACRDDPFIDDERALGTTAQDWRMEHYARAALSSAIGEPYEFSGWVEVVEEDRA